MLIQGTSITVTYKKIEGIKKVYYNNEEILKEFFNEATVLPVPDEAPVEIPRIIIKILNEHAQLNISPVATTFEVHYDAGFEKNWDSCANYLVERMTRVFEFLKLLTNNTYEYVGLVSTILYDEVDENGAKKLSHSLLRSDKINNIHDINIKYTFVENRNIFVNIMLQNARLFKEDVDVNEAGALSLKEQIAESIGATIDINDRYGFNTDPNYKSSSNMLNELIRYMGDIIDNKLKILIEKGEY